jgi:hypothetical protein
MLRLSFREGEVPVNFSRQNLALRDICLERIVTAALDDDVQKNARQWL